MVEFMGKIVEATANGVERLSEEVTEIKSKIADLDKPLTVNDIEEIADRTEPGNLLNILDKPLAEEAVEYDKDGFRTLTEEEKKELHKNTDWADKAEGIQGCKINDDGVIKYPCRNEELAGTKNPIGVEYEKRIVEIGGYQVEVVMPKFDSAFDVQLPDELCKGKDKAQFQECNRQLYDAIQNDSELVKKFTPDQIDQIKDGMTKGTAPEGYTWHHDAETGKMQLVDSDIHNNSRHTGGKPLWGGGNGNR